MGIIINTVPKITHTFYDAEVIIEDISLWVTLAVEEDIKKIFYIDIENPEKIPKNYSKQDI